MNDLKATYDSILKIDNSLKFESFDVVKIVNEYRNYWKPDKIETILLAESHVFTDDEEIEQHHSIKLPNYPTEFVRFVYNLSYGQKNVLLTKIRNNSGTPQYWKLFKEISEKDFRVINNLDGRDKLKQKIRLLEYLKAKGVWLLDCSIVGLYNNGLKPPKNIIDQVLKTSYINFCNPIILKENPTNILVIGKNIFYTLMEELILLKVNVDWIHQPNAKISNDKRKDISKIKMQLI